MAGARVRRDASDRALTDAEFSALLEFRSALREFLRFSEDAARAVGLTPAQHQLMLAIRGHRDAHGPSMSDVARVLLLRHHSAVELVDRAEKAGYVRRFRDPRDGRIVRLRLTPMGERRIQKLTRAHLEELHRLRTAFVPLLPDGIANS